MKSCLSQQTANPNKCLSENWIKKKELKIFKNFLKSAIILTKCWTSAGTSCDFIHK